MRPDLLVVSQVFPPDPASVGQHLQDAACGMRDRGYHVAVVTAARGYTDPSEHYAVREVRNGIEIRRIRLGSLGKASLMHRVLGGAFFVVGALWQLARQRPRCVLVSTSPPFGPSIVILCRILGIHSVVWVMDLNPAQAVASGRVDKGSFRVRVFDRLNEISFRAASHLVAMDSAMLSRIETDYGPLPRTDVVPPWPQVSPEQRRSPGESEFRRRNGWESDFVVMYSGNHSPANPLSTLLEAAAALSESHSDIRFAFIGGGAEKTKVEALKLGTITSLPYQPLETLEDALGAADLHIVTMGNDMLGIVHPCKIYGAMAVGRPVLGIAPTGSHIQEILETGEAGWWVRQGDVPGCIEAILQCQGLSEEQRTKMGLDAQEILAGQFSSGVLLGRLCDILGSYIASPRSPA